MTPHDRYQRRIDLAGEIKQADELVHECRVDVEAKQKALALAEQALKRQIDLRGEKHDEARRLAKEAHDDFMSLVPEPESVSAVVAEIEASFVGGEEPPAGWQETTNVFESAIYTNGISRALDAAQNP